MDDNAVVGYKRCTKCRELLPLDAFSRNRTYRDGRQHPCRECMGVAFRLWHEKNVERERVRSQYYRAANKEKCRASSREWRKRNPDKVRDQARLYAKRHPEIVRERKRRYVERHPERRRISSRESARRLRASDPEAARSYEANRYRKNREVILANGRKWAATNPQARRDIARRYRTRKKSAGRINGHHTHEQWLGKLVDFGHACASCGAFENITRDHIVPLSQGGSDHIDNIQPLCVGCNSRKGVRLPIRSTFSHQLAATSV